MDCCDAILSRRDLRERQRILKDSTCGAFRVIALVTALGWGLACTQGYRWLDGMSGDISGYAITLGECFGLMALAI